MLKDKPDQYMPAKSSSRRQRTWLLSIITSVALIYYFLFYHTSSHVDTHPIHGTKIDWSRYAYSQYATDQHYLCNSVMVFDSLEKLNSKADRVLFYPKSWDVEVSSSKDRISQLLVMARDKYKVKLKPTEMYTLGRPENDQGETTWDASINKLNVFQLGEYDRIIHLDSDITLLKNLDDLFFLPSAPVAMPRAYWKLNDATNPNTATPLTSLLIVLEPSQSEFEALWSMAQTIEPSISNNEINSNSNTTTTPSKSKSLNPTNLFDMDLLNTRYASHALILPHTHLTLLTGEFRTKNHTTYLGPTHSTSTPWNPHNALQQASLIHFSDWPIPKPWIATPNTLYKDLRPECDENNGTPEEKGCEDREVWRGIYDDFRRRRKEVCRLLSVPAPEWPPRRRPAVVGTEMEIAMWRERKKGGG